MFIYRESPESSPIVIPQVSHSWMAWQLADHWGNRDFKRPAPRAEVLAAVLLHDSGWADFDRSPGIDDAGNPITFNSMPPMEHLKIWRDCVDRAASHSLYAGLLVASHFRIFAGMKSADLLDRGETEAAKQVQSFEASLQSSSRAWREHLASDARYEHALQGRGWNVNSALLSACDRVAVFLCAALPRPFNAEAEKSNGETGRVVFEHLEPSRLKVRPWPFVGDKVRLQCEGRRLAAETFTNSADLEEALAHAPSVRLSFTLLRPSAAG